VVNRGLAARFWPSGGAIGARLHQGNDPSSTRDYVVVGIAEDVHVPGSSQLARSAVLYQPPRFASFIVRTATPSVDLLPALRRAITSIQPTPFVQTTTIGEVFLRDSLAPTRFAMALLVAFSVIALLLSTIGLYGVIAYAVSQRTREIGIRVALGAESNAIIGLVAGAGLRLTAAGMLVGAGVAAAATRGLTSMLYGVSPGDPITLIAIALLVGIVALLASYVPARRALRIDPVEALRAE
jgi:predicted lysophospholipase L1 biosynthesis ABC-type transport system permease subunit